MRPLQTTHPFARGIVHIFREISAMEETGLLAGDIIEAVKIRYFGEKLNRRLRRNRVKQGM